MGTESCTLAPPWKPLPLQAAGTVQALRIPKGRMAVLFAEAGQRLYCPGPARLYLGAQGQAPALVRWVLLPPGSGTPA